jgi:hypothetical protein
VVYFSAIIVAELFFLPSVLTEFINRGEDHYVSELNYLPSFGMSVITIGSIFVYMTEVYFRNWAALNEISDRKQSVKQKSISCIRAAAVVLGAMAIITGIAYGMAKYSEYKKQEEMKTYTCKFIDSLVNGTDFYKQCIRDSLIHDVNVFIPLMTPNYKVTYGSYYSLGGTYNCRIEFDNGKVLWVEVTDYRGELTIWRMTKEHTKETEKICLEAMIKLTKEAKKAAEANQPFDINNISPETKDYLQKAKEKLK